MRSVSARLRERLSQGLGIRPGEALLVAGLFVHSLLVGSVLLFTLTSANALFLARVGIGGLPFVYLAVAVIGPLSAALCLALVNRWSQRPLWRSLAFANWPWPIRWRRSAPWRSVG